ncbi:MAG: ATP-binding protein [Desulfosoma sp.]
MGRFLALSLRSRIFMLLAALIGVNCAGALITIWTTSHTLQVSEFMVKRDVQALLAAEKLGNALVMQKGYVTYYYLTGDEQWLGRLKEHQLAFHYWLGTAGERSRMEEGRRILDEIAKAYEQFEATRDQVIQLYREGRKEEGAQQHWTVRDQFHHIYGLTEKFKSLHEAQIQRNQELYARKARNLTRLAWVALPVALLVGVTLAMVLWGQILEPIRRLAFHQEKGGAAGRVEDTRDEVKALSRRVHSLLEDVDRAQEELEESREHLIQSEKLAMVGKLAAGVAHSIRNPLTSVKMRLFSLERSLSLDPTQREDFEVIAEEIAHIDTIVGNFLEFSRPPKLKMQQVSLSDVVDMTLQLLRHRLDSYGVRIEVERKGRLPKALLDVDQMKEVLVNLILNACEAMGEGGQIRIVEESGMMGDQGFVVLVRIKDNGPGIPEEIQDKIFEPFFSTKEEGSGLGLAIAKRILQDHKGWIHVHSKPGQGTTFVVGLPCEERGLWLRS